jgi:quercetin dioxygenase-like cupin family protein
MPTDLDTGIETATRRAPQAYWLLGSLAIVHVGAAETEGRFSLVEWLSPAGYMTPLHVHTHDHQTVYVLEGEVTFYLPGVVRVCGPGEFSHHPAGLPKTERVTSATPARMLDVDGPAGFDRFIASAGQPAGELTLPPTSEESPDLERLAQLAAEEGIELLGPPGALP